MSESFAEKIRSINFGLPSRRGPKKTLDVHDHHKVEVTEHWNDRVDVNVMPEPIHIDAKALRKKESQ